MNLLRRGCEHRHKQWLWGFGCGRWGKRRESIENPNCRGPICRNRRCPTTPRTSSPAHARTIVSETLILNPKFGGRVWRRRTTGGGSFGATFRLGFVMRNGDRWRTMAKDVVNLKNNHEANRLNWIYILIEERVKGNKVNISSHGSRYCNVCYVLSGKWRLGLGSSCRQFTFLSLSPFSQITINCPLVRKL